MHDPDLIAEVGYRVECGGMWICVFDADNPIELDTEPKHVYGLEGQYPDVYEVVYGTSSQLDWESSPQALHGLRDDYAWREKAIARGGKDDPTARFLSDTFGRGLV